MVGRVTDPSLAQLMAEVPYVETQPVRGSGSAWSLREVLFCVAWTFPSDHALLQDHADYLDGSCLVFAEERLLDVVDFRGAHSAVLGCQSHKASSATFEWSAGRGKAASIMHSGDVMSADGGSHVIRVRLAELPACATDCFFVISAYNCRNLSLFRSLSVRLIDADCHDSLMSKFTIEDVGRASAVVVCSLTLKTDGWTVQRVSRACDATVRDYAPVEATLAPVQDHHARWRRRRPYVLLAMLWYSDRAVLRLEDEVPHDKDFLRLLKLPLHLFHWVMQFM